MNITYFEHYPHQFGTKNQTVVLNDIFLALMVTLLDDKQDDLIQEILDDKELKDLFALWDLFQTADMLMVFIKALDKKGFCATEWEEGSHALYLDGYKVQALKEIRKIEMELAQIDLGEDLD